MLRAHARNLAARIQRSIFHARQSAPMLGWQWVLREKYLRRRGIVEVAMPALGLNHPVFCRVKSSDIYEYAHLLGKKRVQITLPTRPEIIVDAGSNVGYSVLRFLHEFPGARIIAIEPDADNVNQIKKNVFRYQNVSIEQAALWSKSTKLAIKSPNADTNGYQVLETEHGDIRSITIEDIILKYNLPRIDLLKIDIEGSEKEVFSKAIKQSWLKKTRMILIETHDRFEPGCTEAVDLALSDWFDFKGVTGEYRLYVNTSM